MRKLLAVLSLVILTASSFAQSGDAETAAQAFPDWGNFLVGGVWTGTDARGDTHEQRWEWVLNKSFLQVTWKVTGDAGVSLVGIDPATGTLTWWGFDDKGRVWRGTTIVDKGGAWVDEGTGQGKGGHNSWKAKLTKLGEDKARLEIQENIVDGESFSPEVVILTRKK